MQGHSKFRQAAVFVVSAIAVALVTLWLGRQILTLLAIIAVGRL